jgi:hypothetical protein
MCNCQTTRQIPHRPVSFAWNMNIVLSVLYCKILKFTPRAMIKLASFLRKLLDRFNLNEVIPLCIDINIFN